MIIYIAIGLIIGVGYVVAAWLDMTKRERIRFGVLRYIALAIGYCVACAIFWPVMLFVVMASQ